MAKIKLSSKNLENNKVATEYKHGIYTLQEVESYNDNEKSIVKIPFGKGVELKLPDNSILISEDGLKITTTEEK